jgi:hypothetical protein
MTRDEQISRFLKHSSDRGYCNACIAIETGITVFDVSAITRMMNLFPGEFDRRRQRCSRCKKDGVLVTMARLAA